MRRTRRRPSRETPRCPTCGQLDGASAASKDGWPELATSLPPGAGALVTIRTLLDTGSRKRLVQQCPACHAYFLYEVGYEFLANGSENEETLRRISAAEARDLR